MLRSVLVGLLVASAAAACSKSAAPATTQAGETAGKVVELTGSVTAVRGTERRTLTVGAPVAGVDVIETGPDSRVAILLAHNNARWDVAPGSHKRVSESVAWGLAKQDTPPPSSDQATASAGRDQEKAGAQTAVTATAQPAAATKAAPPAIEHDPGGVPARTPEPARTQVERGPKHDGDLEGAVQHKPTAPSHGARADASVQQDKLDRPADDRPRTAGSRGGESMSIGGPPGGGGAGAPQLEPTSPPPKTTVKGKSAPIVPLDNATGGGPAKDAKIIDGNQVIKNRLTEVRAALVGCLDGAAKLTLRVRSSGGKAVISFGTARVTDKQRACFQGVVDKLALTVDGDASLSVTK